MKSIKHLSKTLFLCLMLSVPSFSLVVIDIDLDWYENACNNYETQKSDSIAATLKDGKIAVSADTPVKRNGVKKALVAGIEAKVIFCSDSSFDSGYHMFIDPHNLPDSVGIYSGAEIWDTMVDDFFTLNSGIVPREILLIKAVQFLKAEIQRVKHTLYFNNVVAELECRHLATLALPFFCRLLMRQNSPVTGTIHLLSADMIRIKEGDWLREDGHAWNIAKIRNANGAVEHWYVDALNGDVVNLEAQTITKLESLSMKNGKIDKNSIKTNSFEYHWVIVSRERLKIGRKRKLMDFYDDPVELNEGALKIARSLFPPKKPRLVIDSQNVTTE